MKKLFGTALIFVVLSANAQVWHNDNEYIQDFAPFAVEEMELYNIPASITLAQGLLETAGGQSWLAQTGNNHFGIKCKENWTGKTLRYTDDAPNECFRAYDSAKESYRDHSLFLKSRKWYAPLFQLNKTDYKGWAYGLKKAGYATSSTYATGLINKIEKYKLYEFDTANSNDVYATILSLYPDLKYNSAFMANLGEKAVKKQEPVAEPQQPVYAQNNSTTKTKVDPRLALKDVRIQNHPNGNLQYIVAPEDMRLSYISDKFGISVRRLKKDNDLTSESVKKDDVIFLGKKRASGKVDTYVAQQGDTMQKISQKFAIRLKSLYKKNRMDQGIQPKAGQVIYLRSKKPRV